VPVTVDAAEAVWVAGDPQALRRAVDNLLANAGVHGSPPVSIAARRDGDRARLSVSDRGPGLDPEDAAVAFDRFWRAPAARGRIGSGLGLAIVRATAQAHGGDAEVAGATFTIDLPLASPDLRIVREASEPGRTVEDQAPTP
jgi:signal transduction histidine kinase